MNENHMRKQLNYQQYLLLEAARNSLIPVGVREAMEKFGLSKSAAYTLLNQCREWLTENYGYSFAKENGNSIFFSTLEEKEHLSGQLAGLTTADYLFSAEERQSYLLIQVLSGGSVTPEKLKTRFQISTNTCRLDMKKTQSRLDNFGLRLVNKKSEMVLEGGFYDVCRLCMWLASYLLNDLYQEQSGILFAFYGITQEQLEEPYQVLKKWMRQYSLPFNRDAGMLYALTGLMLTEGLSSSPAVKWEQEIPGLDKTVSYHGRMLKVISRSGLLAAMTREAGLSDRQMEALSECLCRVLFSACAETGSDPGPIRVAQDDLEFYSHHIVKKYEAYAGLRFEDSASLNHAVALGMKAVILRHLYGFSICNPLSRRIRQFYSHILDITRQALTGIPYLAEPMAEEDLVPFTVHFLGWMYKGRPVTSKTLHILIVCAANIGTSLLLEGQISSLFPGASIQTAGIGSDYQNLTEYVDFIVSTIPLKTEGIPLVVVNTFLTGHDKFQLEQAAGNKQCHDAEHDRFISDFTYLVKDFLPSGEIKSLVNRLNQYFSINKGRILYETGGKPMLKDLITKDRIQIIPEAESWEAAIRMAAGPLEEDGSIDASYTEAMIESVHKLGPYIVLAPGIALPHARPEAGVHAMSMALMRVDKPVYFNETKYASLFFVLASTDGTSHLDALRELSIIFSDHAAIDKFLAAVDTEELYRLIHS